MSKSKYGLEKMKDSDALLFVQTSVENGNEIKESISDLKMIDAMFHMKDLHFATIGNTQRTKTGRIRKNATLLDALDNVLEARLNGQFD